jgi:hypothetical protein
MSKVITFSRTFPSYHPRKGESTYFVEKILNYTWDNVECPGFNGCGVLDMLQHLNHDLKPQLLEDFNDSCDTEIRDIKHHTIRSGHRFKAGDWFSPRVWSGKPYNSKQIVIAPDIQVKKVYSFSIGLAAIYIDQQRSIDKSFIKIIANNDGLEMDDFLEWFDYPKPFEGQIISWSDSINY